MTDAGFFRGTSADQDNRFADKQKKLFKELNFSPILNTKLNMSKIEVDTLRPWIEQKIKDILEKDDEILSDSIFEFLKEKEPEGKALLVLITGFVEGPKSTKFVEELWTKLIEMQDSSNGISPKPTSSPGNGVHADKTATPAETQKDADKLDGDPPAGAGDSTVDRKRDSRSRSKTRTPPPRSGSQPPAGSLHSKKSGSKSESKSSSKSGSKSPSGSRSVSRSRSGSRSRSQSSSRSPRRSRSPRSRSPAHRSKRPRRSRSRSSSYRRRSRSPRSRRGFGRFAYRGFAYDRRRPPAPQPRRRPSPPWSRRRYSPDSPQLRRRRTPSPLSPRRRSRSPYYRRRSRSRSPPPPAYGHMMGRRSPRPPMYGGRPELSSRPPPPHREIHRPILAGRSPRIGLLEHRGYGDAPLMPRHSPSMVLGRQHDLPPMSHGPPGPSVPYRSRSPSSGRKKHKKDKKHRKHKKSKRHRSSTPEKKKKHKKHKKTKKHKS